MKNKIIKNIPNALTVSRIISSVAGASAFVVGNVGWAAVLYIYGAVSDYFDGLAARKLNAFSEFGRKLDAFSDKIYAGSLLIPSILCGNLLMLIPLALELKISGIIMISENKGFKPSTFRIGKFKTGVLFPTMIVGLLSTRFIDLTPLLWTLLPLTTILQSKSITAYQNFLNYNIFINRKRENKLSIKELKLIKEASMSNKFEDIKDNFNTNENTKEKVSSGYYYGSPKEILDELAFYVTTPDFKIDYNKKNVKRKRLLR